MGGISGDGDVGDTAMDRKDMKANESDSLVWM